MFSFYGMDSGDGLVDVVIGVVFGRIVMCFLVMVGIFDRSGLVCSRGMIELLL